MIEPIRKDVASVSTSIKRSSCGFTKLLLASTAIASVVSFSIMSPAIADDQTTSAEGWESPAKLKPYVKIPSDPSAGVPVAPSGQSASPDAPASAGSTATKTSTTTTTTTSRPSSTAAAENREIDDAVRSIMTTAGPDIVRLRKDRKAAKRLARYHWLDKVADANPQVIETICMHKSAAKLLAKHPRLSEIADADHYVCRRIAKWKPAARVLAANGEVQEVAALDPEGIYTAIQRDRKIIRILSRNPIFDQMIVDNPDLGRIIAKYM